jgi:hypothetical protein
MRSSSLIFAVWLSVCTTTAGFAWEHGGTTVPPGMEIEVLDPNADPEGKPAIELKKDHAGNYIVDIPPVVLVHRHYYSGDRSFQGPILPGGPTIAVVNHPKTGERLYIQLQMMPGAPRVTYTDCCIDYDFGETGVSISFGMFRCEPIVKYRNHKKVSTAVHEAVEQTQLPEKASSMRAAAERVHQKSKTMTANAAVAVSKVTVAVATPVVKIAKMLPGAQWIMNPNSDQATGAGAAAYHRDCQVQQASRDAYRDSGAISTLR